MSDFVLSCCSTADLPAAFFETRNVQLVCFHFTMDGKEYADDLGKFISGLPTAHSRPPRR